MAAALSMEASLNHGHAGHHQPTTSVPARNFGDWGGGGGGQGGYPGRAVAVCLLQW